MKRFLLLLLSGILSLPVFSSTFYDQLCTLNPHWEQFHSRAPQENARVFNSDAEFIRAHLLAVERLLRNEPAGHLSPQQQLSRWHLLDVLHAYALRGIFPANYYKPFRTPVFIDEHGTHCAVGYLMEQSGHDALAQRISRADNYVFVKTITDAELPAWQESSGFTVDELALIQPGYAPPPAAYEKQPACTTVYFNAGVSYGWGGKGYYGDIGSATGSKDSVWYSGECAGGVLHGKWVQYVSPGVLWLEGNFAHGKKHGTWNEYHAHYGRESRSHLHCSQEWKNGIREGAWRQYDVNGELSEEGGYVNNEKEGAWKQWQTGNLTSTGTYRGGKKDGEWLYYYYVPKAKHHLQVLYMREKFGNGILLERSTYDQNLVKADEYTRLRDNLYLYRRYKPSGDSLREYGTGFLTIVIDTIRYEMDYHVPGKVDIREREVFTRTGKWVVYRQGWSFLPDLPPPDSTWYFLENDSIVKTEDFVRKGPQQFHIVQYSAKHPYTMRQQYSPMHATSKTYEKRTYVDGTLTQIFGYHPNGNWKFVWHFKNGKFYGGGRFYETGTHHEYWEVNYWEEDPAFVYKEYDRSKNVIATGPMKDTLVRFGEWKFYDVNGALTAQGNYVDGKREGEWMEMDKNGLTGKGLYVNGKKKGTWNYYSPLGVLERKEEHK